jgi:hypothetical protein
VPKLNSTKAAEVKKAGEEGSKFVLLPVGKYRVKLTDVDSTTARPKPPAREGNPMWIWKFEVVEYLDFTSLEGTPEERKEQADSFVGKEQWYRTVIQDNTLWDLDRVFGAFDAEPDTDTDELVGDEIVVMIDQAVIGQGRRKGQMGNEIIDFFTVEDGLPSEDTKRATDDKQPDF